MKTGYSFGSLVSFVEALDAAAVKITGDQTIAGLKTFSSNPITSAAQGSGGGYLTRKDYVDGALALKAPIASPALTGTPTAPTAAAGTNTTQIATTAFVTSANTAQLANVAPLMDGTATVGTSTLLARQDHKHPTDTSRAPLASPALTGTPTAPTAAAGTNTTQIATTAFVQTAKETARTTTYTVANEADMLALVNAKKGDLAIRSDLNNRTFILYAEPYSTLSNWRILAENVFISDFAKTLLDDADAAAMHNTLGIADLEPRISDNESKVFEALRRSYADAGLNLVKGSFEEGGTLTNTNDVLLLVDTGVAYSYSGTLPKVVAPGTDPTVVAGYVSSTNVLLRNQLTGGGSLAQAYNVINVDLPPYNGDLSALIKSVDSNTLIVLGSRDYDLSSNPQFNGAKKNITLFGSGMPTYSSDGSRMEGGTRLLGNNVFGSCSGFAMYNLGLDCGSYVIDTLYGGTSKDGLLSIGNDQFFENIRVLIKSNPAQLKHGIIFEGHENITHGFLETRGGYHGYVAKSKSITGGDVVVNETAGTMAIFKADNGKTYTGINVNSVTYKGKDGLNPSLIFEAITNGTLSGVHIGSFVARGSGPGVQFVKDASSSSLSDIHIDFLDLDGCTGNGFALDNSSVGRVSIGFHTIKNCSGQGFYIDGGYGLNLGIGKVVNAGQNGYFFGGNLSRNNIQFGSIRADGCGQYGVKNDALIPINPNQVLGSLNASGLISANFEDITVALGTGWSNDFFASKVKKIGRLVTISGIVISAKTNNVIMTLPAHLRPSVTEVFSCPVSAPVASGAVNMVRVFVQSDTGQVKIDTSAVSAVGAVVLSGISFFTAY